LAFASLVVLLAGFLITRTIWTQPAEHRVRLVVLPFDNLSGDPAQDYIADGLTEELITSLGRTDPRRLGVTARSTANSYRHSRKTVREIGQELGAEYVLEGSVRGVGDQVRVSAQLIRVEDQSYIWADDFDHGNDDVVSAESELAAAVCHQVRAKLLAKPNQSGGTLFGAEEAASALK
jgi:TolB-like protein